MRNLQHLLDRIRQWAFPPAFRISVKDAGDWAETLVTATAEALIAAKRLAAVTATPGVNGAAPAPAPADNTSTHPADQVDIPSAPPLARSFVVGLCNQYFRLRRNTKLLTSEKGDSKELRSIERALRDVAELMEEQDVECLDLTDHDYDDGDERFEPAGIEEVDGLDRKKITYCECPAVLLKGKLLQRARGLVGRPATDADQERKN